MNSLSDIALELSSILISLALLVYSFFALFRTQRLIDFNLKYTKPNYLSNSYLGKLRIDRYEALKKKTEKRWFHYKMKICGIVGLFVAILILASMIHAIFKVNFGAFTN
jgi:hypothetical protein